MSEASLQANNLEKEPISNLQNEETLQNKDDQANTGSDQEGKEQEMPDTTEKFEHGDNSNEGSQQCSEQKQESEGNGEA